MRRVLRWIGWVLGVLVIVLVGWVAWVNVVSIPQAEDLATSDGPGAFIELGDERVHVRTWGPADGAPIVLVPGFGPPGTELLEPLAAELADAGRLVVAVDHTGFGWSDRPVDDGPSLTPRGRAAALEGVASALDFGEVDVLGHSYGGGVALQWALDEPDRVDRLVLVDAQVYDPGGGFGAVIGGLPLGIGRAVSFTILGAGPASGALFGLECDVGGYCPTDEEIAEWGRPARVEGTASGLVAISRTAIDADYPELLPPNPALVVWGANDTIVPLEEGRRLADELPDAELVVLGDAAHDPILTHPVELAELALEHTG